MRKMIGGALVLMTVAFLTSSPPVLAQGFRLGVFDPQRVSEETAEGKRVQNELSTLRDKMQGEISAKEATINELQQQLNQQALSLSADKRTSLQMDIQRKLLDLNNANDLASRELQLEVAAAQAKFNEKLMVVVEAVGREEGFDLILDRSLVAWSSEQIGMTTAIIDSFNKMFPATGE
jgi:outer membrane protein